MAESELAPKFAPFIGMAGIASAIIFGCVGAAYGTAKAGIGIAGVGTFRPDLIMKSLIPVVMAGIIAVYGLVVAVLIAGDLGPPPETQYSLYAGCLHLAAGLSVGLAGLAAGYTIGIVGEAVSCATTALLDPVLKKRCLGNTRVYATVQGVCRNGLDIDFWRSPGSIWFDCWSDSKLEEFCIDVLHFSRTFAVV
ncbi:V-type proton ATPase proteolipid subunit 2 [Trichophyton rubrum D6]|uniref:V-type proton ATPase proteolipid subunit n=3 Tax=Trichophyton TaxID=5550 RepID=A0A080WR92_TRIRC|nr:V-type proton ATPase proteolipid subunit 2 [Trichophyton rubrum CBS 118892]EZF27251.1 V-type proton ATPase proteolipid subunit 2 [Trichophyton rubrum MR850]EZF46257.1 V-type proton ATPase proteolipid subunit 2 [Trichophyton rubrum CBS 100081]EZF56916.1 V-type proton ATPase proteolipid subunit 2 [Trichophyton rubrum CBS 288.86]EZF67460.1 V-type proton ATPase proteolipid subunit 2 [Trichophyton rubrum CBS 289.86]EZF78123.1 V-type proton ATPase proteolipid subunit 2 [Trichophyton soudanense CB